ncbi:lamin tail domain-containing protein [Lentimicrobium sp. S6]|uniref:lamin tail domain-containing protein n=1 Tax=Lentimicrobium sp. S6 TaxID=2735872 RepID=UPI0015557EC7|nr:lamin tail domain-containing protein [Lentimicrobium sp. S6]NPD47569.1 T9SS type A sorting domain-containing protein [Lentimicrobium sp. S6]
MRHLFLFFFFSISGLIIAQNSIRINEVCSRNLSIINDEDGDYEDWIEIYNPDTIPISLKDYYLSDDKDELEMWAFPDIILDANEYLLIFASGKDRNQPIDHWETALHGDSIWRMSNPEIQSQEDYILWTDSDYDDSSWIEARGGFGVGYENLETITDTSTIFLRQDFFLTDTSKILNAVIHAYYEDGFTAYLNGYEIMRPGMVEDGVKPPYNKKAFDSHPSKIDTDQNPESFVIEKELWKTLLKNGRNILALSTHLKEVDSIVIKPWLSFAISDSIYQNDSLVATLELGSLPLHTNFKISGDGENIYLFHKTNGLIEKFEVPAISSNISFGNHRWLKDSVGFFKQCTPGLINSYGIKIAIIQDSVELEHSSGYYQDSVLISVTNINSDFQVYYTINGSLPTKYSNLYDTAFHLDSTSLIRMAFFTDSLIQGPVSNFTFFINEDSELDVISILMNPNDLWNPYTGIYVLGYHHYYDPPYFGANYWQNWEKASHIQYFNANEELLWQQDLGIKIHGNYTRQLPQKSFGFYAKSEYGLSSLPADFIPSKNHIKEPKRFLIRNAGNDYSLARFRDLLIHRRMMATGIDIQSGKPVLAFLNGEYWGMYHFREKIDRFYLENNHGINPDEVNLLEQNGLLISGDRNDFEELINFIKSSDLSLEDNFNSVEEQIELDNWIDNLISNFYHYNTDWPQHNTKFWNAPGHKWRQILVDQDVTMGITGGHTANRDPFDRIHNDSLSYLAISYNHFLENETFIRDYSNRFADLLNTIFLPENYLPMVDEIVEEMEGEMQRHGERWNTSYTAWLNGTYPNRVRTFIEERTPYLRQFLRSHYSLGVYDTVTLSVNPQGKGQIKLNTIFISENDWSGIYFDSIPIRLEAIPNPGYQFVAWESETSPQLADSSRIIESWHLKPHDDITAIFYSETGQEDTLRIAFTEFNYRSYEQADAGDWIEIYNLEEDTMNLTDWSLQGYQPFENWKFPEHTKLAPHSFLVIANDTSAFHQWHPQVSNMVGPISFKLKSEEEEIKLLDEFNRVMQHMSFTRNEPWPVNEETSQSIELIDLESNYSLAENWQLGCPGGSPGVAPKNCQEIYPLIFTEINYKQHEQYPVADWIEMKNIGNDTINLSHWRFSDGNLKNAFQFVEGTFILPQEKVLLIEDTSSFFRYQEQKGRFFGPLDFGFSASGEELLITNEFGLELMSLEYSNDSPWPENAAGTGFTIELIDENLDMNLGDNWTTNCFLGTPWQDLDVCIKADALLITELKYQSTPEENSGDWIEIKNISDKNINLYGWNLRHQFDTIYIDTNYMLYPEEYIVLAADTAAFYSVYERDIIALATNSFDLSKEEDQINICDPYYFSGNFISYHHQLNWPIYSIDTNNRTLELINMEASYLPESWRASCENGTPGLPPSYCITDGLDSFGSLAYEIKLHPNPSAGMVSLEVKLEEAEKLNISVSNIQGVLVLEKNSGFLYSGQQSLWLDMSHLESGVYLVEVRGKNGSVQQKMIKLGE